MLISIHGKHSLKLEIKNWKFGLHTFVLSTRKLVSFLPVRLPEPARQTRLPNFYFPISSFKA
jgi:hypothetical protein